MKLRICDKSVRLRLMRAEVDALRVLVAKDFACLTPRDDADESEMYPNPDGSC